ncbi:MAG: MT-A70 family methyltransferase [Gammaproteobacteria bacterium]
MKALMPKPTPILALPGTCTKTSLVLPDDLCIEDWNTVGAQLKQASGSVMWWLGDWLNFGERKYGEMYAQAMEATEYGYQALKDAKYVSTHVEWSRRRDHVPHGIHREVASLAPPDQERLLAQAEAENWTVREMRRAVRRTKAGTRDNVPFPDGKYRVIYADPPWEYGNEQPEYQTEQADHYPLLSMQAICDLPVKNLAMEDAVLFLWVTSPILRESFDVVSAWGFEYKAAFIWDKVKHNMGHYNSVRHELLLICVRGSCQPEVQKLFDSVQSIERTEHSRKPEEFRSIIDTIYPSGPRIEMFARSGPPSPWKTWGNE